MPNPGAPDQPRVDVDHQPRAGIREERSHRRSRLRLAGMLVAMGSLHLLVPKPFITIVPRTLRYPRFWVYASGVAEMASGSLLLSSDPNQRRRGGWLAAATMVGVYPANIQMAVDAGRPRSPRSWATWLRLPLQAPLVAWAVRTARRGDPARPRRAR